MREVLQVVEVLLTGIRGRATAKRNVFALFLTPGPSFGDGTSPPIPYTPPRRGVLDKEMRRRTARALYEIETEFREDGWPSDFVYDAEQDLYRFADGEFAFFREYANERRLREMGAIG
jgi:hypothetical protein